VRSSSAPVSRSLRPATFVIGDFEATPAEPNRGSDQDTDLERGEKHTATSAGAYSFSQSPLSRASRSFPGRISKGSNGSKTVQLVSF
jgi:hypothetical protein